MLPCSVVCILLEREIIFVVKIAIYRKRDVQLIALDVDIIHFDLYSKMIMCQTKLFPFVLCAQKSLLQAMDLLNARAF